ncbi:MAG: transcriptional regulator PpsR [Pseudomonadota bacterium]
MIPFKSHQSALKEISHESMAELLGASHDISLLINTEGVIIDVAFGADQPLRRVADQWVGKRWSDTVSDDSLPKIERLLDAADSAQSDRRWRQVNHPTEETRRDIPVLYLAIRAGDSDLILAIGKDLSPISDMQQQLLDMQHAIENDYRRLQQAEARYRVLFQHAREAILIVDPDNGRVVEANPSAAELLHEKISKLAGGNLNRFFAEDSHRPILDLMNTVRSTGKEAQIEVKTASEDREVWISGIRLQRDNNRLVMLRLVSEDSARTGRLHNEHDHLLLDLVEHSSDGVVVTDHSGLIITANPAFLALCQVASQFQLHNQPLDQWLGRAGVDVSVLRKNLVQRGAVRQFFTTVNVEYGAPVDVELSAAVLDTDDGTRYGYVVRRVIRRSNEAGELIEKGDTLHQSVEQMTELVGRVPLKDLVRETTDIIEKMCIETALKMTSDNRASAAEMLGLSRQSLYVKLRRHGLNNGANDSDSN